MQKIMLEEEEIRQMYQYTKKRLDKTLMDVVQLLDRRGKTAATAESCTGGMLAQLLTSVPGASHVFELGLVTYAPHMKTKLLEVPDCVLSAYGVVSAETASAMLSGLRRKSGAYLCLSTTGLAGPGGGTPKQPVGTVYAGLLAGEKEIIAHLKLWEYGLKTREEIRHGAAVCIFGLAEYILMEESRCRIETHRK